MWNFPASRFGNSGTPVAWPSGRAGLPKERPISFPPLLRTTLLHALRYGFSLVRLWWRSEASAINVMARLKTGLTQACQAARAYLAALSLSQLPLGPDGPAEPVRVRKAPAS